MKYLIPALIAAALSSCVTTTAPDGTRTTTVNVTAAEIAAATQLIQAVKAPVVTAEK